MTYKYDDDDLANTVLALADDFLAEHSEYELHDARDVYDWLVARAAEIRKTADTPETNA